MTETKSLSWSSPAQRCCCCCTRGVGPPGSVPCKITLGSTPKHMAKSTRTMVPRPPPTAAPRPTPHLRRAAALVPLLLVLTLALAAWPHRAIADLMIVGNDEKVVFDAEGNRSFVAPGKDTISVVDITNREAPKILVSFPLMNSIFGPPVNLAITADERLAIVANSVDWVQDGASWKPAPDNKLYVFNLKTSPPSHIGTVEIGKQPSGLAIYPAGDLALVANRPHTATTALSTQ